MTNTPMESKSGIVIPQTTPEQLLAIEQVNKERNELCRQVIEESKLKSKKKGKK